MNDQTHSSLDRLETALISELVGECYDEEIVHDADVADDSELENRIAEALLRTKTPKPVAQAVDRILAKGKMTADNNRRLAAAFKKDLKVATPQSQFIQVVLTTRRDESQISLETLSSRICETGSVVDADYLRNVERGDVRLRSVAPAVLGAWAAQLGLDRALLEDTTRIALEHDDPEQTAFALAAARETLGRSSVQSHVAFVSRVLSAFDDESADMKTRRLN